MVKNNDVTILIVFVVVSIDDPDPVHLQDDKHGLMGQKLSVFFRTGLRLASIFQ